MTPAQAISPDLKPTRDVAPAPEAVPRVRLAYLTTEYPKVSHTFIRREIIELERRGHHVLRLAIRDSGGAIADDADRREAECTFVCLSRPKRELIAATTWAQATRPLQWLRALRMTVAMNRASDRGVVRHMAYLAEAALLTRVLLKNGIDHLHCHFGTNGAAVARLIRCLGGPPYSMTVHGPDEFDAPRAFCLAEKVNDADFVVAISDFCGAQLRRWTPPSQWGKIHVVRCTVGDEFFHHARPIDPRSRTLICVGRLNAQKGHALLLEAARRLVNDGTEFRLVLAGDGEMRAEIESRIDALRLRSYVEVTGWLDERGIRERILESRALVQSSFAEGLPVVLMEAMALGRPVISTMIAGIPELVRHGENGWLVPAGNVDELCAAMLAALAAPAHELNARGVAGQRRVRENHRTAVEVPKLESLFAQARAHRRND